MTLWDFIDHHVIFSSLAMGSGFVTLIIVMDSVATAITNARRR